jgi:hypothetical protein
MSDAFRRAAPVSAVRFLAVAFTGMMEDTHG